MLCSAVAVLCCAALLCAHAVICQLFHHGEHLTRLEGGPCLQVLGRVLPKLPTKSSKVVPQFKEAAAQRPKDADLWELLGDLLAAIEPAGGAR